jgi:DNA-binding NtrC family response regulator
MRLLHLEDEGPFRNLFKIALATIDPKVELIQFMSADEANTHLEQVTDNVKVFVMDIRVPGNLDGLDLAKIVREKYPNAPIIMTSAYQKPDADLIRRLNLIWMPKPVHILNISQKIIPLCYQ